MKLWIVRIKSAPATIAKALRPVLSASSFIK